MRKYVSLSLLLLLLFGFLLLIPSRAAIAGTLQDIKTRGKLIAGVKTDYPPFGSLDKKGVNNGFEIDIVKAIARELFGNEKAIEFVSVPSSGRIAPLDSGRVDCVVATMTITEWRKKRVDFSTPYFITAQLILVRKDSKITKYQDLAGKKVATVRGSTGDIAIKELVPSAERVKFVGNFEALRALKEGKVEAFVQDYILLYNLLQKNPDLRMADLRPFRPGRYGVAVRKGDQQWLDFINATLSKMKKTGEYRKLLDKWFGPVGIALWKAFEPKS